MVPPVVECEYVEGRSDGQTTFFETKQQQQTPSIRSQTMSDDESASSTSTSSSEEEQPQTKKQRTVQLPPPLEIAPTADASSSAIRNQASSLSLLTGAKGKSNRLIVLLDQAKLETITNY